MDRPPRNRELERLNTKIIDSARNETLAAEHVLTNKDRRMAGVPTEDVRLLVPQTGGPLAVGATLQVAEVPPGPERDRAMAEYGRIQDRYGRA